MASAESVTSVEVNAIAVPRPSLLYPAMTQKCVLALVLALIDYQLIIDLVLV